MAKQPSDSPYLPWLVVFSASLFFFYIFIQMNIMNAIGTPMMSDFKVSAGELGSISASFYYANALLLFPAGIIIDRFSTKKIILIAISISILGVLLMAFAQTPAQATLTHGLTGIGGAFCFLSSMTLASRWFPPQRLALITGLIVTVAMLGGVVAQTPASILTASIGWHNTLFIDTGLGLVILAILWIFVRDYPSNFASKQKKSTTENESMGFWSSIGLALKNPQNWLCGTYTCLLNLPIALLGALWGQMYLTKVHHFTNTGASVITSMIFWGTIVGSPVFGWFSDKIERRKLPMFIGAIISLIIVLLVMYLPSPSFALLIVLFFLLGLCTSSQVIGYPVIAESNNASITATSLGVASFLIIGGGGFFQPIFGQLMDMSWNGTIVDNVPVYAPHDFFVAMVLLPAGFIIGLLATYFLKETRCKNISGKLKTER